MAKFKPARGKTKASPRPQGGLPCVILVIAGFILLMLFVYYTMVSSK